MRRGLPPPDFRRAGCGRAGRKRRLLARRRGHRLPPGRTAGPLQVARPTRLPEQADLASREFLRWLDDAHLARHPGDGDLAARISASEPAARMQLSAARPAHLPDESAATLYDLHATFLHLPGLDQTRLSFYNDGIERRLTDVHGHVIEEVAA